MKESGRSKLATLFGTPCIYLQFMLANAVGSWLVKFQKKCIKDVPTTFGWAWSPYIKTNSCLIRKKNAYVCLGPKSLNCSLSVRNRLPLTFGPRINNWRYTKLTQTNL